MTYFDAFVFRFQTVRHVTITMLSTEILYDAFEDNLLLICMILSSCVTSFGFFQLYANTKEQYELLALICQAAKVGCVI